MRDYIGDMLTRIRNGQKAKLGEILLHPFTPKQCVKILHVLEKEGFIYGWTEWKSNENNNEKSQIKVILKYSGNGKSAIQGIYRISKPGCKVYISTKALWKPKSGIGIFIISTPIGILTDRDARHFNVGGELLCGIF